MFFSVGGDVNWYLLSYVCCCIHSLDCGLNRLEQGRDCIAVAITQGPDNYQYHFEVYLRYLILYIRKLKIGP